MTQPFDHPEWLYEIKHDGFRALAHVRDGECKLVSRTGYVYKRFVELAEDIAKALNGTNAILDGEICCLDREGKTRFNSLMYRRSPEYFYAFDLLQVDGKDIRPLPLIKRKQHLKRLIPAQPSRLLYVDYLPERGQELFRLVCDQDLEGIVAKHRYSRYSSENGNPAWVKIKNKHYSQVIGRHELFEREPEATYHAAMGWDSCTRVCLQR